MSTVYEFSFVGMWRSTLDAFCTSRGTMGRCEDFVVFCWHIYLWSTNTNTDSIHTVIGFSLKNISNWSIGVGVRHDICQTPNTSSTERCLMYKVLLGSALVEGQWGGEPLNLYLNGTNCLCIMAVMLCLSSCPFSRQLLHNSHFKNKSQINTLKPSSI